MLIDMHVHTSRYSACAHGQPEEMVRAAQQYGLDALVITEHHVMWEREELAELQRQFPLVRLYTGVEISSDDSGDLLVIGAEGRDWFSPRMPAAEVVEEAHARGGVVIAAHPFRPGYPADGLDWLEMDAIEVHSLHMHYSTHERAVDLATRRGLRMVATSDAHVPEAVGFYGLRLEHEPRSEAALAELIRVGAYTMQEATERVTALNRQRVPLWRAATRLIEAGYGDAAIVAQVGGIGYTDVRLLRQGAAVGWPAAIEMATAFHERQS